jgi:hypothetical protein
LEGRLLAIHVLILNSTEIAFNKVVDIIDGGKLESRRVG